MIAGPTTCPSSWSGRRPAARSRSPCPASAPSATGIAPIAYVQRLRIEEDRLKAFAAEFDPQPFHQDADAASATLFRRWQPSLPGWIRLLPLELPGRGLRFGEALHTDAASLVAQLAGELQGTLDSASPYAFFGHSLGALVAFGAQGHPVLQYLAVLVFSGVGGLIPGTLCGLSVSLAPDRDTVSTTVGWMQQFSALGQFLGPPVVAWVATQVGGWQSTWWVTASSSLLGLLIAAKLQTAWRQRAVV